MDDTEYLQPTEDASDLKALEASVAAPSPASAASPSACFPELDLPAAQLSASNSSLAALDAALDRLLLWAPNCLLHFEPAEAATPAPNAFNPFTSLGASNYFFPPKPFCIPAPGPNASSSSVFFAAFPVLEPFFAAAVTAPFSNFDYTNCFLSCAISSSFSAELARVLFFLDLHGTLFLMSLI